MPDLGLEVLLKGKNMVRLLGGLGVALKISAVSVLLSLPLGILLGVLMTFKNPILKAILRVYLEFIRIMPQMVLLFLVYFGTTRAFGWDLSGETAAVIVFVLWGTAEMSDLVRGALIAIPKHQYESSEALGMSRVQTYWYIIIPQTVRRLRSPAGWPKYSTLSAKAATLLAMITFLNRPTKKRCAPAVNF